MRFETTRAGHGASEQESVLLTTLRRLPDSTGSRRLLCRLRYAPSDPYTVALDLVVDVALNVSVTWRVARDLLDAGSRELSGEGDFRVWPSSTRGSDLPSRLYFRLSRPDGDVTFEANAAEVRTWLDATYALVPAGTEHQMIDWASLEDKLLNSH